MELLQWWELEEYLMNDISNNMKSAFKQHPYMADELGMKVEDILKMDNIKLYMLCRKFMFDSWLKWSYHKWWHE